MPIPPANAQFPIFRMALLVLKFSGIISETQTILLVYKKERNKAKKEERNETRKQGRKRERERKRMDGMKRQRSKEQ